MNFAVFLHSRLRWLNVPGAILIALLQRSPVVRVAALADEFVTASPIGNVLRSAVAAAASLGAVHSLAGATRFVVSSSSVSGTVGTAISADGFSVQGATTTAGSYRITSLPPGLTVPGMNSSGVLNASSGVITGTPTAAGTYRTSIVAYEFNNTQGDSFGPTTITFTIAAGATSPPAITTQPASQTVNAGMSVTFTAAATGSPSPNFQWSKDGVAIAGATSSTLTLAQVTASDFGSYTLTATNSAGTATSNPAMLTVLAAAPVPVITTQPMSQTVATGSTTVFTVVASDATTFQWSRNGTAISGATSAMLVLTGANVTAGSYTCVASNATGSATSNAATLTVGDFAAPAIGHLVNVSILNTAGPGAAALTVGAVIGPLGSTSSLPLVVRAVGPTLASDFGLTGALADPVMTVNASGNSTPIATNDNWGGGATMANAFASVGAFALPAASLDSAFVSLGGLAPGGYTVQVTGKNNTSGVVIAEIYDAGDATRTAATPRLINLSTLTQINAGASLAAGFVLRGQTSRTLLVRGVGPSLTALGVGGVMGDPKLALFNNDTKVKLAENDNWGGDSQLTAVMASVGAFPLSGPATKDAVIVITLPPGTYSAQVSDATGASGTAIVEVYEVP